MEDPSGYIINEDDTDHEDNWPDAYSGFHNILDEVNGKKKRANNLPSLKWVFLSEALPPLKDYIQYLSDNWEDRQPDARQVEKMRNSKKFNIY